jgi:hypothetical protein
MMDIDPIEEIHRIRKKLYAEAGGNPAAYALSLRASQGEGGRKVVSLAVSSGLAKAAPPPTRALALSGKGSSG